jgi:hypothetical protein
MQSLNWVHLFCEYHFLRGLSYNIYHQANATAKGTKIVTGIFIIIITIVYHDKVPTGGNYSASPCRKQAYPQPNGEQMERGGCNFLEPKSFSTNPFTVLNGLFLFFIFLFFKFRLV